MSNRIINSFRDISVEKYFVYPNSFWNKESLIYFIVKDSSQKYLGLSGKKEDVESAGFADFTGKTIEVKEDNIYIKLFNQTKSNLGKLVNIFPSLSPSALRQNTTFGFGDRLGLTTPAHIQVINKYKNISPVFAQQSVRELKKTGRSFRDIIDAAIWGIFQEGYKGRWGADADHIKDRKYFLMAAEEGMTMFTLDTSEVLEEQFLNIEIGQIKNNYDLKTEYIKRIKNEYIGKVHKIEDYNFNYNEELVVRMALIYGEALDFTEEIYWLLKEKTSSFDYEVSFDETDTVTSPEAHYFIASEMHQRNIDFSSLALRFPGTFEKGIDYEGSVSEFKKSIKVHSGISRKIGSYKLSLHSGSDKFSIYPILNKYTGGVFHIKISGTSWLEAVHLVSVCNPGLFREIFKIAVETFNENKKAYHVNLDYNNIPKSIDNISDKKLCTLVYDYNLRRVFHIAYGTILDSVKEEFCKVLFEHEEKYYQFIIKNLGKHLQLLN